MTWTSVTTYETLSYSGVTYSTTTHTADSASTAPGWNQLSVETDAEDGVDFVLRASEQFPMLALDDTNRALVARDSAITEGT
jgi:hypothetical protein